MLVKFIGARNTAINKTKSPAFGHYILMGINKISNKVGSAQRKE